MKLSTDACDAGGVFARPSQERADLVQLERGCLGEFALNDVPVHEWSHWIGDVHRHGDHLWELGHAIKELSLWEAI